MILRGIFHHMKKKSDTSSNTDAGPKEEGILLVDKPKGITSFDVIRLLRKKLGERKLGHAGTLDPLASGLLIIGVGSGTKKLTEYIKLPKTYEAQILLGRRTDTGDLEGKVVEEVNLLDRDIDKKEAENVLGGLIGVIKLPVPAYSAVKRGGKALYKYARSGEKVEIPIKDMKIESIALDGIRKSGKDITLDVVMDVGSGTYIRSVAEEIGRRLGVPATVSELRRTRIGEFYIKDAEKV